MYIFVTEFICYKRREQCALSIFFGRPSNCHCSSIKATDPVSTAFSSSLYARNNCYSQSFFCLHIKTHTPQRNLAQKCAVNYCLLLREIRICRSIGNISRLRRRQQMGVHRAVMYLQHGARYLAGLNPARADAGSACSGRRNRFEHTVLSAAFICIVLPASAGPLPGSRRRKDSDALSSPFF